MKKWWPALLFLLLLILVMELVQRHGVSVDSSPSQRYSKGELTSQGRVTPVQSKLPEFRKSSDRPLFPAAKGSLENFHFFTTEDETAIAVFQKAGLSAAELPKLNAIVQKAWVVMSQDFQSRCIPQARAADDTDHTYKFEVAPFPESGAAALAALRSDLSSAFNEKAAGILTDYVGTSLAFGCFGKYPTRLSFQIEPNPGDSEIVMLIFDPANDDALVGLADSNRRGVNEPLFDLFHRLSR